MAEDTEKLDLIATAKKLFEKDCEQEKELREEAEKDLRFEAGDQWDAAVKADRIKNRRPALTFNRSHTFVQQVSNEARQNKVQVKYIPGEDGDKEEAAIYEGLARYIQSTVEADEAIETAAEYAAAGGFGVFGYMTEYCDDDSDYQDVKLRTFPDPFQVYGLLIPAINGDEPTHCFVVTKLTKEEYKQQFPDGTTADLDWSKEASSSDGWIDNDEIRIAEYWILEKTPKKDKPGRFDRRVMCYTIDGYEVLKKDKWGGKRIPHIAVLGKSRIIDGKPKLYSVIRFQRDPQQLVNFYKTRIAETLGTAPIQPYLVQQGQITPELRAQWEGLATTQRPYIEYVGTSIGSTPAPAPVRQVFEPPIGSLSAAAAQEIDDMKAAAGIFDPSLGAKAQAVSGIAKARDQQQAAITNMHFPDNVARALKRGGAILRELIPVYYQEKRIIQILGENDIPKVVTINGPTKGKDGQTRTYKIGDDANVKYNVIVDVGKSFSTKRMESFDFYAQLGQASPEIALATADIALRNSDSAGADEAADRMKRYLGMKFPGLIDNEQDGQQPIPPQVQQQMQQMKQAHDQINAYSQQLEQELQQYKAGAQVKQMEIQSRESIERMKIEAQITIAEITTKAQETQVRLKMESDLSNKLQIQDDQQAHEGAMAAADAQHEQNMAQMQHDQGMQAQEAQVQGQSQLASQTHGQNMEAQQAAAEQSQAQDASAQ